MRAPEVTAHSGITYRQLDHWTTRGWLEASAEKQGTGYPREWSNDQAEKARRVVALLNAGFTLHAALELSGMPPGHTVTISDFATLTIVGLAHAEPSD